MHELSLLRATHFTKSSIWAFLAIRNGERQRPKDYNRIYWDFIAAEMPASPDSGQSIPLQTLMKEAGFTQAEFDLLAQAQANSDGLVNLEVRAMNAVKGLFADANGEYTVKSPPDLKLARDLLHSKEYHRFKGDIMVPLNQFISSVENRLAGQVAALKSRQVLTSTILGVSAVLLLAVAIFQAVVIVRRVIGPISAISTAMSALAEGKDIGEIPGIDQKDEIGAMARATAQFKERSDEALRLSEEVKQASVENEEMARKNAAAAQEAAEATKREQDRMAKELEEKKRGDAFQREIADVISAFAKGNFDRRLQAEGKKRRFCQVVRGLEPPGNGDPKQSKRCQRGS